MSDQVMVPLETVTDLANWLLWHRDATIMDVMAEFDLTHDEALFALATARLVIRDIEQERAEAVMLAERDRLRAGQGTNDELADYEATRRMIQADHDAWDEDEAGMQRIKDEWDAFDRDPPGS